MSNPHEAKQPETQNPLSSHSLRPDDGGLHAPTNLSLLQKLRWWFHFVILVNLARLRFIFILIAIGLAITKWDTLVAYYERWTRPAGEAAAAESDYEYFCPMHPSVIRDNPNEKCPICFMPLSKRKKGERHDEPLPAGTVSRVQLTPYRIVLAGVRTWTVSYLPLVKDITAVGYIEFNERGQRTVSARAGGRIDKLFVNETGEIVQMGDVLASLYSPDLLVTVRNLLDAQRIKNTEYLQGAKTRLELLGIDKDQIDDLLHSSEANTHLKIRSPISGHITKKYVREGQYVQEGSRLYDIDDLSTVWVEAQVYEDDLVYLPLEHAHKANGNLIDGPEVTATTRAFPNEPIHGKLSFIYPHVDQDSRTVMVRFELDNPGHKLRPGSTATVELKVAPPGVSSIVKALTGTEEKDRLAQGKLLAVPEGSVIDTGGQKVVYRESSPGVYDGVLVTLGPRMLGPENVDYYPVLRGLKEGDRVVTSGSFLVDAETRLNPAAGSIYIGGSGGDKMQASGAIRVRPSTPADPDASIQAALATLSPEEQEIAKAQRYCPILPANRLGAMGIPVKVLVLGQRVFLCCNGCRQEALAKPKETLARANQLKAANNPANQ
jgi:membrane fusion protein, copper/silver efflux system